MTRYEIIVEELQNRVDAGEITLEFAESVNDLAYERYIVEKSDVIYADDATNIKKSIKVIQDDINDMKKYLKVMKTKSDADELSKRAETCKSDIKELKHQIEKLPKDPSGNLKIFGSLAVGIASLLISVVNTIKMNKEYDNLQPGIEKEEYLEKNGRKQILSTFSSSFTASTMLSISALRSKNCRKAVLIESLNNLDDFCDKIINACSKIK